MTEISKKEIDQQIVDLFEWIKEGDKDNSLLYMRGDNEFQTATLTIKGDVSVRSDNYRNRLRYSISGCSSPKIILHLCADLGSDSLFYQLSDEYEVIMIGEEIGVENYNPPPNVWGIIANPVCTEFSTANGFHKENNLEKGMFLVNHCLRIIEAAKPKWWVIENPANGRLKEFLGKPRLVYQPWEYGSPWTKKTALWGEFNIPAKKYTDWNKVPKNDKLYIRPGRPKPALAFLHKSAVDLIPEMQWAKDKIKCDADIRSMCSAGFAEAFFQNNR